MRPMACSEALVKLAETSTIECKQLTKGHHTTTSSGVGCPDGAALIIAATNMERLGMAAGSDQRALRRRLRKRLDQWRGRPQSQHG